MAFPRDVKQAYIQSATQRARNVYIKALEEMCLHVDAVLHVARSLHGIPESGLHWYLTYLDHHQRRLEMERTTMDPCVLVKRCGAEFDGIVLLQVDDSLALGTPSFLKDEDQSPA